jgi:hypothetical protein
LINPSPSRHSQSGLGVQLFDKNKLKNENKYNKVNYKNGRVYGHAGGREVSEYKSLIVLFSRTNLPPSVLSSLATMASTVASEELQEQTTEAFH